MKLQNKERAYHFFSEQWNLSVCTAVLTVFVAKLVWQRFDLPPVN